VDTKAPLPNALVYDPRYHSFESWAALMCEAYAGQNLEIPDERTDWKAFAVGMKGIDVFSNEAIPGPYIFEHWQDWAQAVVNAVNPVAA
jgi:hypothetical protein